MRFYRQTDRLRQFRAFTLAEVLAALALMAIVIPVAIGGMSAIARTAELGQRKTAAMRVAERVMNEQLYLVTQGQAVPNAGSGVEADGNMSYPWTLTSEPWPQDNMTELTLRVTFVLRGLTYEMSTSTLYDPNSDIPGTLTTTPGVTGINQ
jgi:type II secretory pathway pseudopilin PulG